MIVGVKGSCIVGTPVNELEVASMEVKGVFSIVIIVQDNVNHVVFPEDIGKTVRSVYGRVRCGRPSGQNRIERGNLGHHIGFVIEKGTASVESLASAGP